MRLVVAAFVLAAAVPTVAHHPVTSYYDVSQLVAVTGVVVEFRVNNPHVVLIVSGATPDGRSGLWAFEDFRRVPSRDEGRRTSGRSSAQGRE